ncbi:inositol monophosphatase [Variovorax paradoxus]|jgi:fructose-1,6-bisphosphatase/inositol monophosphatase family enzyme|uniref:inositol monophosphatase family protein n=1 Tax=Variovorax paradoxus TaxID=34073 RepID=UPI0006E72753|nr:inositol monophosphatase [Variovorax paradoxus]KPU94063.1 inositol monophosphatase [Variovorax paradoxus]KPU96736.1 inositol monophosphatase [Variovorax paradoxus]KPV14610.1 inositol monophosphatase [Variovorax paradoxus]KPV23518.1 inositol monophosphatase [Variovorax paradoxus]
MSASPFTSDDLAFLGSLLATAAREEIMPRFRTLHTVDRRRKTSSFDIVTDADEACEAAVLAALRARHPEAVLIGEEACARDPALLEAIDDAELAFIVDPLDGTKNFASGLPLFGTMASVTARGEVIAAAIHDPVRADTAFAIRGGGAWIESASGARHPLQVAPAVPVEKMEAIVGTNFLPEPLRSEVNARLSRLGMTNWFRCAAHEYRLAAAGDIDALFYNKLMPWDHAAGWLLHREAGGYAAHHDGSAYRPAHRSGGLICAADRASFDAVRAALLG